MKILGINASPRGDASNTGKLVEAVLEGAREAGADVEFVDLCALDIDYCDACGACYATGECPHIDDMADMLDRIAGADGIVLGSPNYINSVTAQMKTFFDRLADSIHCQLLRGKYGCSVCTAGGSRADEVTTYMNETLFLMGATIVGGLGELMMGQPRVPDDTVAEAKQLGGILAEAIRTKMTDPEQETAHEAMREHFRQLVISRKDEWTHDYEHWSGMGWL
jgi:multimeric flavodoxin WrbA